MQTDDNADRGGQRFRLIRALKGFDNALTTNVRTGDADIALGRSERYSASNLQHRTFEEPCTEFGGGASRPAASTKSSAALQSIARQRNETPGILAIDLRPG